MTTIRGVCLMLHCAWLLLTQTVISEAGAPAVVPRVWGKSSPLSETSAVGFWVLGKLSLFSSWCFQTSSLTSALSPGGKFFFSGKWISPFLCHFLHNTDTKSLLWKQKPWRWSCASELLWMDAMDHLPPGKETKESRDWAHKESGMRSWEHLGTQPCSGCHFPLFPAHHPNTLTSQQTAWASFV